MSLRVLGLLLLGGWYLTAMFQTISAADVVVQLNVNRPLNDVNEKFVNFAMKPEELYRALDGDNRRIITRMAALLGESYIKFINDYEFAMNSEMKLRNPTKIIWRGFNRWARAVNWTMVIPVPYDPDTWDPIETLRILNSSYLAGIHECVWQLGTDFGASHAEDYVSELGTLNMMVDSFKPYVDDWRIMGADISVGSSAEETRRYIEMSKDLNSAFGWTQSSQSNNPLAALSTENEPALRVLLQKRVPVWLTLPPKAKLKTSHLIDNVIVSDEATEGLTWAKTLGEAASSGFDAVFKRITASDLERPTLSYYVSALFKKVMGSRVFPARPLNMFTKANKLYTHCANTISGGIAFMIVNMNDNALQMQMRSLSKTSTTDVWQYTLTMRKGNTLLNNERLYYNTTLKPQKTKKQQSRSIVLGTPARSVSFWVLPNMNLDHCQYTEIVEDDLRSEKDSSEEQQPVKRYSSSDKLLRKLIQESSVANNPLVRAINRRRRYATKNTRRSKRFVLKEKETARPQIWAPLFRPFSGVRSIEAPVEPKLSVLSKREHVRQQPADPINPLSWFTKFMENTMTGELPLLRRGIRSTDDDYFGPLFTTKDGKTTTGFTKKIKEIKAAEEQSVKPLFDNEDFDEEEFFRKLDNYREPVYQRLPEGDVMLQFITSPDGEDIDDFAEEQSTKKSKSRTTAQSHEILSEMKPMRLLPTEIYESMPVKSLDHTVQTIPGEIDSAFNTLLYPDPILKKPSKTKKVLSTEKDIKPAAVKDNPELVSKITRDFIRTQKELRKSFGEEDFIFGTNAKQEENPTKITLITTNENRTSTPSAASLENESIKATKALFDYHYQDYVPDNIENFFSENENVPHKIDLGLAKEKFEDIPWWDVTELKPNRSRRALHFNLLDDDVNGNLISRDVELLPLGARITPEQIRVSENYLYETNNNNKNKEQEVTEITRIPKKPTEQHHLVSTFKEKVSNLVDAVAGQLSDWYETFTKHISGGKKIDNSTKIIENNVN